MASLGSFLQINRQLELSITYNEWAAKCIFVGLGRRSSYLCAPTYRDISRDTCFHGHLLPSDWAVFEKYARRVRSLEGPHISGVAMAIDNEWFLAFCSSSSSAPFPLVPNLRSLDRTIESHLHCHDSALPLQERWKSECGISTFLHTQDTNIDRPSRSTKSAHPSGILLRSKTLAEVIRIKFLTR
ncbi:hypothetical protein BJ138DRAFT_1163021 [Hygrophoropsis aurantiaca]|uniref:Uncharacterized protein n=1 Tax=Hygrophoropsis aurantiaca TaxID=72124 RepID=A0ACB7ZYP5_9AGAM|nr:hypothetical protein BJ138DRAFT_1163021 [Hygrophoropsis aurantiaca]